MVVFCLTNNSIQYVLNPYCKSWYVAVLVGFLILFLFKIFYLLYLLVSMTKLTIPFSVCVKSIT